MYKLGVMIKRNNTWGILLLCAGLVGLICYGFASRTLLRYRFDASWFRALFVCLVPLMAGVGCAQLSKYLSNPRYLPSYRSPDDAPTETLDDRPPVLKLRWWERAALILLFAPLAALAVIYFPPLRQSLIVRDHRIARSPHYDGGYHEGWGFAIPENFYDPTLGPLLMRDETIVENLVNRIDSSWFNTDAWMLAYIARRMQGRSESEIWQDKHGRQMFLGALASESRPPQWWNQVGGWLGRYLTLQPAGTFQMGLLSDEIARARVQELASDFENISDGSLRAEVIYSLWRHPVMLKQPQVDELLEKLARLKREDKEGGDLSPVLNTRRQIRTLLSAKAHDGAVGVNFIYPEFMPPESRAASRVALQNFVATCGLTLRDGDDITLSVNVAPRFQNAVLMSDTERIRRPVTKTRTRSIGFGKNRRTINETYSDVEISSTTTTNFESASVATVSFSFQGAGLRQTFELPPYGKVDRKENEKINAMLLTTPGLASASEDDIKFFNYFFVGRVLSPWRFGL